MNRDVMSSVEYWSVDTRVPVSLRLPTDITAAIEKFASKNGTSKTDAYVHFLRLGISAESGTCEETLEDATVLLERALDIVKRRGHDE